MLKIPEDMQIWNFWSSYCAKYFKYSTTSELKHLISQSLSLSRMTGSQVDDKVKFFILPEPGMCKALTQVAGSLASQHLPLNSHFILRTTQYEVDIISSFKWKQKQKNTTENSAYSAVHVRHWLLIKLHK